MSRGYVVIPKASDLGHMEDNWKAQEFTMDADDVAKVTDSLNEDKQLFLHTPDQKYNVYA